MKIHITELDISIYKWDERDVNFDAPPEDRMKLQAELYGEIFALLRDKKDKVDSVTFWGLTDKVSWLNGFPVKRNNYPLLFDGGQKRKEAYYKVTDF
jgi:endo-1,4-beta-xylanase